MALAAHINPKHQAVVVAANDNLRRLFPQAKEFLLRGAAHLAVPHLPAESFLLSKLGYPVPSPVLTHYDWCGGTPFEVQKKTVALLTMNERAYVLNGLGCVDADTEYLSETGWVRIADYSEGKVAQYHPDTGTISFVTPNQFVKLPCREMIRFRNKYGVDQLLSPEHRVLLADGSVVHAEDIEREYGRHNKVGRPRFRTTFKVAGTAGVALTDEQIRVQIAVNADGYERPRSDKVVVRLKKKRKIVRLRVLLAAAGIVYDEAPCAPVGFVRFVFVPPRRKGFDSFWWSATQSQLEVIADEITRWDGTFRKSNGWSFSSYTKADADFAQYAYSAVGRRAALNKPNRSDGGVEYVVTAGSGSPNVCLYGSNGAGPIRNVWREPSTDGFKYCFMVPTTFLLLRRNGRVFATGNTGKTRSAIWAYEFLRRHGVCRRMLVLAPLSTLTFTWAREVFTTAPHLRVAVLHGTKAQRLARLKEDADIYVLNHDGLKVIFDDVYARDDIDVLLVDELAVYRNGTSQRTKILRKLAQRKATKFCWGMTGAPIPNSPTDVWAQASVISPHTVPKFYTRFRDELMLRVTQFKWAPKPDAVEKAFAALQPAVRFTLDDIMELPERIDRTVDVPLGEKQEKVYKHLVDHAYALVRDKSITAANAGAVMSKLLQVSCGWVYSSDKGVVALDNNERIDALVDAVRGTDRKVLVFVPFKHALAGISKALTAEGIDHAVVSGDTSASERSRVFSAFQNTSKYHALVAHPQCLAHGLTLTSADTIVWFSPTTSLEVYEQSNARIRRYGQTHKQLILHLQATPVERKLYGLLRNKQKVQDKLLALFEEQSENLSV